MDNNPYKTPEANLTLEDTVEADYNMFYVVSPKKFLLLFIELQNQILCMKMTSECCIIYTKCKLRKQIYINKDCHIRLHI